jgi:exo-beta-1,3-glucanase (GH17 family)
MNNNLIEKKKEKKKEIPTGEFFHKGQWVTFSWNGKKINKVVDHIMTNRYSFWQQQLVIGLIEMISFFIINRTKAHASEFNKVF